MEQFMQQQQQQLLQQLQRQQVLEQRRIGTCDERLSQLIGDIFMGNEVIFIFSDICKRMPRPKANLGSFGFRLFSLNCHAFDYPAALPPDQLTIIFLRFTGHVQVTSATGHKWISLWTRSLDVKTKSFLQTHDLRSRASGYSARLEAYVVIFVQMKIL